MNNGIIMYLNFCKGNSVVKFYYIEGKYYRVSIVDCYLIISNGCMEILVFYKSIKRIMEII